MHNLYHSNHTLDLMITDDANQHIMKLIDRNGHFTDDSEGFVWFKSKAFNSNHSYGVGICNDYFSIHEANVVCRYLGYLRAEDALKKYYYSYADSIVVDVICNGSENSLDECQQFQIDNCELPYVYVICTSK